jgi:hypothetical protein
MKENIFALKKIQLKNNRKTQIIMQNENGPCPLISISKNLNNNK